MFQEMHRNCLISNPSTSLKAGCYFDLSWSMNNTLRQFNEAMDNHHFYTEKSACWSVDLQTGHGFAMISSFTWDSNCYEWTRYGPSSLQTKPLKHQIMFYTIIGCFFAMYIKQTVFSIKESTILSHQQAQLFQPAVTLAHQAALKPA